MALLGFSAIVIGSTWLWGAHYTPVAGYEMAILVAGFSVGRALGQRGRGRDAFALLTLVAAASCGYGLWQHAVQGAARAHAWFETPNLMAAFVNLALIPMSVLTLLRKRTASVLVAVALMWAGLLATLSRGGLLGALGGVAAAALLVIGTGWRPSARALAALGIAISLGYGFTRFAPVLLVDRGGPHNGPVVSRPTTEERNDSAQARLQLYAMALGGIATHPLLGSGYLSFGRLVQRERANLPAYAPGTATSFVHDDYLQVLLELGMFGLLPFLGITCLPLLLAYRRKRVLRPGNSRDALGIAATAGLASMALHGLVDFPFYVPGTLAGYGLLLGVAADWLCPAFDSQPLHTTRHAKLVAARLLRAAVGAGAAYALAMPAASAGCSIVAREQVQHGNVASGVYWLQVARNFDPRDWRRHWQLGALLAQEAVLLRSPKLAQFAANAYAAGMRADPGGIQNLLGWLDVERSFGARLPRPASPETLRKAMREAMVLAPLDLGVRLERVLVLRHLGEAVRARTATAALERDFPHDAALRRLLAARVQPTARK